MATAFDPSQPFTVEDDSSSYETSLTPQEEEKFTAWKKQHAPNDSGDDYDLRGAFKEGLKPDPKTGHWPDTYKKPNHKTFSNESKYAVGENLKKAGSWDGENFIPSGTFNPNAPFEVEGDVTSFDVNQAFEVQSQGEEYARDLAKSVVRGATSEGVQMAAEGVYRGLAENIAPVDRDEILREEVQGGQRQFLDAADNTALIPEAQAALTAGAEDRIARANQEQVARRTTGTPENQEFLDYENSPATQVADTLRTFADEAASQRQAVREALPVSQAVAQSIPGQLAQGAGQLINAPAYIVPGVGPAISVAQLYQEGYDDYVNTKQQRGEEVIPSEANAAATTYAAAAGPIDVLVDSLPAGQALKAMVGKAPIRQALAEIGKIALAGGASEGFQQAALNTIASQLAQYDPERPLTQDVLNSVIIGGAVSGIGAAGAEVAGRVSAPQVVKETKVTVLDAAAANANQNSSPLVAQELSKQANTLQQTPANIVAPEATEAERRSRQEEILSELDQPITNSVSNSNSVVDDQRFAPPPEQEADIPQAVRRNAIRQASIAAENLLVNDPDQVGQSSLRDWRSTLPPEVASSVQAHGAPIGELQNILDQGITPDRPFYTAPLNDSGSGALGLRDVGTGGQVLVLGAPGQQIKDSGVQAVVVNDYLAPSIPQLQAAYPDVTWLNTQNATQWLNEQQSTGLAEPTASNQEQAVIPQEGITPQAQKVKQTTQPAEVTYGNAYNQSTRSNPALSRGEASQQAQARNASLLQLASRGNAEASQDTSTPESRARFLEAVEAQSNIPAAEIEQFPVEATGTAEHYVRLDPRTGRAIKVLFPNRNGMFIEVTPDDAVIRQGTLPEYLKRVELFNEVFDGDLIIEGTTRLTDSLDDTATESPSLVVSQTWEVGGTPTQEEVSEYMRSLGFQPGRRGEQWYRPEDGIYVADARTANFVKTPDGVRAIDLLVTQNPTVSFNNNENTESTDSGGVREAIQPPVAESQAVPSQGQNQPAQRIQIGSSPQTHVIVEELPQSAREAELNEKYYRIRNERTGEEQTVEQNDMRFVKGKAAEAAIKPEIDAVKARIEPLTDTHKDSVFSLNNEAGGVLIPDFQDIQDAFTNIASSLNQAYDNFTDWSGAMVRNFGNGVVKFLQRIYNFLNTGAGRIPANQLQAGAINIPFLNPANPNSKSTRQPFRKVQKDARYKPEGIWSAAGKWNKQIFNFLGQKERNVSANLNATEYLAAKLKRERAKAEKSGTPISSETLNIALGNTDNHLTDVQFQEARAIRDPETRAAFELTARLENQANARIAQQEALDSLPEPIRNVITEMRSRIDQLSHDLRTSGAISGDIAAAIDDNLGLYLHRSYSIFDNSEAWKEFINSDEPQAVAVRNKAEALFQDYAKADAARVLLNNSREAGNPITQQEALDQLQGIDFSEEGARLLEDYLSVADDGEKSILGGRLPGQKNRSIVTMRGQIPQEIRDLWGEQKDATTNFAKTYASMSAFLENDKFLKNVLRDGLITADNLNGYIWKEGESPGLRPRGFTQLVGDGSKAMEPLNGAWMPPELTEAFTTYYQGRENNNALLRFLQAATGISMKSKTAWSWASTMRNFFGNIAFMTANGNLDLTKLSDAKNSTWANLTKGGEKEIRDRIENYIRLGVVGDNVGPQLIKEITAAANLEKTGDKLSRRNPIISKLWNAGKATDKLATDIYSSVDDFWKVFAFENELNKIKQAYPNETQAQQEQRAANIVRDTVPTYSLAPEIVRNLKSNFGVAAAPFITFTTEVLRTTYNTVKTGVNEIKEGNATGNNELRSIGIKRLASFAATQSFFPALALIFKQLFDYDDEDEDAVRKFLPDWQKNAQLLLLDKDDKGNPRYIDVSFLDPYGYLKEPVIAAIVQSRSGKSADEIAKDATVATLAQIAEPFLSEQILAGSIMDVARNTNASGGQVYNPQDKTERKVYDQVAHVLGSFTPGTLTSLGRIYKGVTNQVSPTGRAYDAGNELSSFFLGQRVSSVDPQTSLDFVSRQYKAQNQDATSLLNRVLKSRGTISEGSIGERYEAANIAKQRLVQELRDKYKSAITLGATEKEARRILDDASIGNDALQEVVSGQYRKYRPSTQTLNDVRKNFPERIVELNQAISATPDKVPLR